MLVCLYELGMNVFPLNAHFLIVLFVITNEKQEYQYGWRAKFWAVNDIGVKCTVLMQDQKMC
jgi:hypothetical protein